MTRERLLVQAHAETGGIMEKWKYFQSNNLQSHYVEAYEARSGRT